MNALKHKKKQVPEDVPAVVFVLVPPEWSEQPGMDEELLKQADRFFYGFGEYPGTTVVNLVAFMNEHYQDWGGKGRLTAHVLPRPNLSAHHPAEGLLPLLEQVASEDDEREFLASTEAQQSEFFRWAVKIWSKAK